METPLFRGWRMLFAMLGAPFIWSLHFLGVWGISEWGCRIGMNDLLPSGGAIPIITMGISLVALTLLVIVGMVAYQLLQRVNAMEPADDEQERELERTRFIALVGIGGCILFGVVSTYVTLPILFVPSC